MILIDLNKKLPQHSVLDEPCSKCGVTLRKLLPYALMTACGAKVAPDPFTCEDGNPHDFPTQGKGDDDAGSD